MTARTQLTFPSGSKPAIMMPAPKAIPATDAETPAQVSNQKNVLPMKPRAEPITIKTPMTHIKSFNASGFHLATSDIPPCRPHFVNRIVNRRSFVCHLVRYLHVSCKVTQEIGTPPRHTRRGFRP